MPRRPGVFLALTLLVSACGNTPTAPPAVSSAAPSSDQAFTAIQAAISGLAPRTGIVDVGREQLVANLGLRTSLGTSADDVLGLAAASQDADLAQEPPLSATPGGTAQTTSGPVFAALPITPVPPPDNDVRELLAGTVPNVGLPGDVPTRHLTQDPATSTRAANGLSGTTVMNGTIDAAINGSVVTVQIGRSAHSVVSDIASNAVVFDETLEYQITAQIDVCPTTAGVVEASVANTFNANASTTAGPGGRAGSHETGSFTSTSAFHGQVDDQANLGVVSQDYKHEEMYKRTTSVAGGPDAVDQGSFGISATGIKNGVPASHAWSLSLGDWSQAHGTSSLSGSAIQNMITSTAFSAALDYTTIDSAYVAAQPRWRKGVCVVVTSPTYGIETHPGGGGVDGTEEVAKGSTTVFQIGLRQRYGAAISTPIVAELASGKESLTPDSIDKPPGSMTYVAPDQDGQDANLRFTSTSKQGIGVLVLVFHTGAKALQISISGTSTTSALGVSYMTKMSLPKVILTQQPDGTYLGSGPVTASVSFKGVCPHPFTETGTMNLKATREVVADPTQPQNWYVSEASTTKILVSGSCLGISLGSLIPVGPDGAAGDFMRALGMLTINSEGANSHETKQSSLGASTTVVNADIEAKVITDPGK